MRRRSFMLSAATFATALPRIGLAASTHPSSAALRIGNRILGEASSADVHQLRNHAISVWGYRTRPPLPELAPQIAADFRNGVIWRVGGVSLSRTEAAWFVDAAQELSV